ncbi:MAG: M14 family zinc carboxypeptidase, partial [Gemmatimonadaceae bacterium]
MRALAGFMAASVLAACGGRAVTPPAPVRDASSASGSAFDAGLRVAERHRVAELAQRRFTHAELWRALAPALASPALRTEEIGQSLEGRELRAVTFGGGATRVLLWSQMHGDESTATMALADVLRWMADTTHDPLRERLRRELTVVMVPMLNPDGAEVFERENAAGIDVNRDARRLATPEARALKALRDRLRPQFGFNLHDQQARTRVGPRGTQAAIALLAPPRDERREYDDVRSRARLVAATLADGFARVIPGRVSKYDDAFNPRAFGDLMQQWGTSTVLIESGALPDDPQKQRLRALNVAALLDALDAIATRRYLAADPQRYEQLPYNTGGASDLLIVGGQLVVPGRPPLRADVAVNFDDAVARTGGRVRDVGDLAGAVAIDTLDATGLFVHAGEPALTRGPR